jgi:hypothetical protein
VSAQALQRINAEAGYGRLAVRASLRFTLSPLFRFFLGVFRLPMFVEIIALPAPHESNKTKQFRTRILDNFIAEITALSLA